MSWQAPMSGYERSRSAAAGQDVAVHAQRRTGPLGCLELAAADLGTPTALAAAEVARTSVTMLGVAVVARHGTSLSVVIAEV